MEFFLSKEKLEKLSTKRLLAYKNKIMKTPDSSTDSWGLTDPDGWSKEHPEWQRAYADLKVILATREHVEK
jgi:hypothetical protein